ncbi:Wzz/FepE/Etk N-terminal domain-containing protein [Deferribacter autotrophicus]|uniref:Wzz/FepE/Etk N-terminal domain-containing protein n=1 Tax=Deferribacter autotrophicus TaxID=500465 RepID=UPI00165E8551|nr:Wzz/FepE/Etk N-terminal domain-containing protein [Deferribacter autotrophicus]
MENKSQYQNIPNYYEDEIDLYELWLTIKKYKKLIFAIVIVSLIIATLYTFLTPRVYTVENTLFLPNLKTINDTLFSSSSGSKTSDRSIFNKNDIKNLLSNLDKYDENTLKNYLKLNDDEIQTLKSIKVSDIKRGNLLTIRIDVQDIALAKNILNKILDYINNLNLIKESLQQNKLLLEKERDNLYAKIVEYKFLIKKLKSFNHQRDNLYLGFDPYGALLDVEHKYNLILETLKTYNKFNKITYLSDPIYPNKPSKPKTKLIIAVSFITSLMFGIFLAFFIEWIKNAQKRYEKNN